MSRIQLSQPSYANGFARSIGESVAPELWPNHAWVPAFGPTGATLFDIVAKQDALIVNGVQDANGISFSQNPASGEGILAPATTINQSIGSIFQLVKKKYTIWDNFGALWNVENATNNAPSEIIAYKYSTTTNIYFYPNIDDNSSIYWDFGTNSTTFDVNTFRTYGFSWQNTKGLAGYINGELTGSQFGESTWTVISRGGNSEKLCIGKTYGTAYECGLTICAFYVYDRILSASDFALLHQDPLLPFRRRMPVFYSVPSAGGGTTYQGEAIDGISFGESTAARGIFGATAIDGIGMGEGRSGLLKALLTAADGIKLSDLSTGRLSISANGIDGIALTDAASAIAVLGALASDGITLSDTGSGSVGISGLIGEAIDGFKIGDTSSSIASLIASAIDGATLGDSASTIASMISAAIDGIIFSDSVISGSIEGIAADGIKLTDSSLAMLRILKSVADGIAMSDTASGRVDFTVTCADGSTFGETVGAIMTMLATASDTFNLGDISVYLDTHIATITLSTRSPSITFTLRKPTITFN